MPSSSSYLPSDDQEEAHDAITDDGRDKAGYAITDVREDEE
jgi:hypothetical protein